MNVSMSMEGVVLLSKVGGKGLSDQRPKVSMQTLRNDVFSAKGPAPANNMRSTSLASSRNSSVLLNVGGRP